MIELPHLYKPANAYINLYLQKLAVEPFYVFQLLQRADIF